MRKMLPADYQFYFFDGRHKCQADQEVQGFFPPPYWAWYSTPTTQNILDAHNQILSIIREHGEFDAVIGFSQVWTRFAYAATPPFAERDADGSDSILTGSGSGCISATASRDAR